MAVWCRCEGLEAKGKKRVEVFFFFMMSEEVFLSTKKKPNGRKKFEKSARRIRRCCCLSLSRSCALLFYPSVVTHCSASCAPHIEKLFLEYQSAGRGTERRTGEKASAPKGTKAPFSFQFRFGHAATTTLRFFSFFFSLSKLSTHRYSAFSTSARAKARACVPAGPERTPAGGACCGARGGTRGRCPEADVATIEAPAGPALPPEGCSGESPGLGVKHANIVDSLSELLLSTV